MAREETASKVDEAIKQFLDVESVPYIRLTGNTKERSKQILDIIGIKDINSEVAGESI